MVQSVELCVVLLPVFKVLLFVYRHGNTKLGYNTFLLCSNWYWAGKVRGNGVRVLTDFIAQKQKQKEYHKGQYFEQSIWNLLQTG